VRAIAADREPYQRQFGLDRPTQPLGVEPPAQEMGPSRAYQKSWIGESGSGMTKAVDAQGGPRIPALEMHLTHHTIRWRSSQSSSR